jgi:hypothetical protein
LLYIRGEVSIYICPNPVRRADRGPLSNRFGRLEHGQGAGIEDIERIKYAIIDIDPANRDGDENADRNEHGACEAMMRAILAGEPAIARACYYGSSGNGATILVRLADLDNDARNRAAVRGFVRALAGKYPPRPTRAPGSDTFVAARIDENTNVAKSIGLPGSLKCRGPHSEDRPRRVVELCDLDRDVEPFDLWTWLALNAPDFEATEPRAQGDASLDIAPRTDSPATASKSSIRRRARAAREWLALQPPARQGQGGDEYTFAIACGVVSRCWYLSNDDILKLLDEWNRSCEPPWSAWELKHKVEEARKVVDPPSYDPLRNFDITKFFDDPGD